MPRGPRSGDRRVGVRCFGRVWILRDVPASTWMEAVTSPDMAAVFPGLVRNRDAGDMFALWTTEPDMPARCFRVAQRALERAGRREWHWSLNMIQEVHKSWTHLNGILIRQGVRADEENLSDYLDAAYTVLQERLDEEGLKALDVRLRKLPSGGLSVAVKPRMSSREDLLAFAKD